MGGQLPPSDAFASVDAGSGFACGVRVDGTLVCWGDDTHGQASPPAGTFTSVVAGTFSACGVRTDGSATCWGDLSTAPDGTFQSVTIGSDLYPGADFACGLTTGDAVVCWGAIVRPAPQGS
jgi:hypothetical protein